MFWAVLAMWYLDGGLTLGQWGLGGWENPAAYGTGTLQISTRVEGSWIQWSASAWGQGLEVAYDTLSRQWAVGFPAAIGFSGGAVGYRIRRWGGRLEHDIGVLLRSPRLSLGQVFRAGSSGVAWRSGVGIRPWPGGMAWVDVGYTWGASGPVRDLFRVGMGLRLYRGVWVGGLYDGEHVWGGLGLVLDRWVVQVQVNGTTREIQGGLAWVWPRPSGSLLRSSRARVWTVEARRVREMPEATWWGRRRPSFTRTILALDSLLRSPEGVPALLIKLRRIPWNYAQLEEVRRILKDARDRGVVIWVYAENLSLRGLYLASVAHRVFLHPEGMVVAPGVYLERVFLKGTLEKLGVEVEAHRVGRYKSAVEILTRDALSPEDSLQKRAYLQDLWDHVVDRVARGRGMEPEEVARALLSRGVLTPQEALVAGLVDEVRYEDQVDSLFRRTFGKAEPLRWDPRVQPEGWGDPRPVIAVVVAEGDIVVGKTSGPSPLPIPFFSGPTVGSWSLKALMTRLRRDPRVRAVVLRIHSPGGSAQASEDIWREVRRVAAVKPVVVSMGGVAASGGYYIASGASRILANATTLTGSIGILWVKPVLAGLFSRMGLSRGVVKIGEHADVFSPWRGYDAQEREVIQRLLEEGYRTFLRRVAEGRNLSVDAVDAVAQGRIWSGKSAREVGLVDALGGVREAVQEAARMAGVGAYRVEVFPVWRRSLFPMSGDGVEALWRAWYEEPFLYRTLVGEPRP